MSVTPRIASDPIGRERGGSGFAAGMRAILREIGAGATVALIVLPFCVSAGVLAYEPFGRDYIGIGAATGILCAVAGGVTGALVRSSSFVVNVPSAAMALVQASFVSSLLAASGGDATATLAVMPLSVMLAGLWQVLFSWSGLARAVKFTPYPVLAGFVTGLAVLTFAQQAPRLLGSNTLGQVVAAITRGEAIPIAMPLFGLAVIGLIRAAERWTPRLPAMLVGLVGGTAVWHGLEAVLPGLDLGRTIGEVSLKQASIGLHLDLDALMNLATDGKVLQALLLTSLTLAVLGTLDITFTLRAVENLHDLPAAPRRNLAGQGLSNIVSSLTGALAVTSSIGFSVTNYESGGRTRLSTVSVALVLLVAAILAPRLIGGLPIVVLAAILLSIAWKMWDRWVLALLRDMVWARLAAARTRARRNAAIVAAVLCATVLGQPVVGALVGVMLSCLVFIIEMSRPVIHRQVSGAKLSSKRIRSQADRAVLRQHGDRLLVFELQGVLFFGNADDLASQIKEQEAGCRTMILDLRRVTDLDTSGATVVRQIARRCCDGSIRLIIAAADDKYRELLHEALADVEHVTLFPDLDSALEFAEDMVLAGDGARTGWTALAVHETDLAGGLSASELGALSGCLKAATYRAGEHLCRAGEPADKLWLIARGSVSVRIAGANHARRIAALGPGTSVGEMGLLDRRPRSADVVADDDVEAYVLAADDFDRLLKAEPHLGQSLLATIARLTAQRLRATSEELRLQEG